MCFQDESVSVREAAVDLLGKHISARQDLALAYFDILATAVRDLGTSVRKRAINIMWESCIQQPGFQRASDACVHILGRISDSEESIQKLVIKIFHSLWFSGMLCRLLCMPERCSDTCPLCCIPEQICKSSDVQEAPPWLQKGFISFRDVTTAIMSIFVCI